MDFDLTPPFINIVMVRDKILSPDKLQTSGDLRYKMYYYLMDKKWPHSDKKLTFKIARNSKILKQQNCSSTIFSFEKTSFSTLNSSTWWTKEAKAVNLICFIKKFRTSSLSQRISFQDVETCVTGHIIT